MGRRSMKTNGNGHYAPNQVQNQHHQHHKNLNPTIQLPRSWDYYERFKQSYFFPFKSKTIEIKQSPKGPYIGSCVWDTSIVMSKYFELVIGSDALKGKRIIEVGSGVGLLGITLSNLGADIILTDQENMHDILNENVTNNCPHSTTTQVKELWWGSNVEAFNPPFDMIVGSDLIYEDHCIDILLQCLLDLSSFHPNLQRKAKLSAAATIDEQLEELDLNDEKEDDENENDEEEEEEEEEVEDYIIEQEQERKELEKKLKLLEDGVEEEGSLEKSFALEASDTVIYLGYEHREMNAELLFFNKVAQYFDYETIHTKDLNPGFQAVDIRILKMKRKPTPQPPSDNLENIHQSKDETVTDTNITTTTTTTTSVV
ncbi:hypothetical protein DLAC_06925 [Tieghemostelium lacteum]|uniref:Uncharacterized protein n=1 Tax=Tieghemostelium lacteum TaxID=361077 RepID=A0A151ZDQ1_TIELA|nr:hypothetical protein DLAC_06925 [Tieghemostelium lacteum]|eukprot:KYQ92088.1 hypothetical protein DLAC_06925 [Tieghemostelium lacteum]